MKLHMVQHESFEAPAAIEEWARRRGHAVSYSKVYRGDKLPSSVDDFDFLVVMGGPQCPATTPQECPHYNAKAEMELIRKAVDGGKYVLGVCLGAQLIGEALGAPFDHSPSREIGVYEVTLTGAGEVDPIFSTFPKKFMVGHWHGDMPGLTRDSQVLAYSEGCPRQIVRYTPRVYGFQCHFEFTPAAIEGMIEACSEELENYKSWPFIEDAETLRSHDYSEMNSYLYRFLDYIESLQQGGLDGTSRCAPKLA